MCEIFIFLKNNMEIIVSMCALSIALLTYYQSRTHNYLSVKPIANILPLDYENKICVILQNKGVGPLITKSIKFVNTKSKEEKKFLIDFMPKLLGKNTWTNFSKASKYILIPNEDKVLLEYSTKELDDNFEKNKRNIREALKDIVIHIEYEGVYGNKTEILEYQLKWYKRHFKN